MLVKTVNKLKYFHRYYLIVLEERPGGLPEHELELAEGAPPDARVPGLELGLPLVEEVDQVGGDREEDGLGWGLSIVSTVLAVLVAVYCVTLLVSFRYHLSSRCTSLPMDTSASRSSSNSAVSISEGIGR